MKKFVTLFIILSLVIPSTAEEEHTQLGKHMDELSSHLKSLRKVEDEDWEGKAAVVRKAQDELMKCFSLVPALTEKTEDAQQKAEQIAYYKQLLAENLALLCKLELAFYKEDEDLADDVMDEIKSLKKKGHTEYIEEE